VIRGKGLGCLLMAGRNLLAYVHKAPQSAKVPQTVAKKAAAVA
jgi:hypothetical protein